MPQGSSALSPCPWDSPALWNSSEGWNSPAPLWPWLESTLRRLARSAVRLAPCSAFRTSPGGMSTGFLEDASSRLRKKSMASGDRVELRPSALLPSP